MMRCVKFRASRLGAWLPGMQDCRCSPCAAAAAAQKRVQHPPQALLRLLPPPQAALVVRYDDSQQPIARPQHHQQDGKDDKAGEGEVCRCSACSHGESRQPLTAMSWLFDSVGDRRPAVHLPAC